MSVGDGVVEYGADIFGELCEIVQSFGVALVCDPDHDYRLHEVVQRLERFFVEVAVEAGDGLVEVDAYVAQNLFRSLID